MGRWRLGLVCHIDEGGAMIRMLGIWAMVALAGTASAAPVAAVESAAATVAVAAEATAYSPSALKGTWLDESGTAYTFSGGSKPKVKKILDTDGEIFETLWSGWNEGQFQLVYRVPSTGYVVIVTITGVEAHVAETAWVNDHLASGTERFFQN
jgi:hypothetical protein